MMMNGARARAIYCDDIRQEILGKLSFIGVYNGELYVPKFPATLSKLCAYVTLDLPLIDFPKKSAVIRLFSDDLGDLARFDLGEEQLAELKKTAPTGDPDAQWMSISFGITMSPLILETPTLLRVRADVDDEEVRGPGLRIRLPPAGEENPLKEAAI